ncbi:MAG: translation initiation factor IF-3, partial [Sphingomonadaceae bacterium]
MMPVPQTLNGPRYNEYITVPKVRVIDENGD